MSEQTEPKEYLHLVFITDGREVSMFTSYPLMQAAQDVSSIGAFVLNLVGMGWTIESCLWDEGAVKYTLSRGLSYLNYLRVTFGVMAEIAHHKAKEE